MKCVICNGDIPVSRLEVSPVTVTCSTPCSQARARDNQRRATRSYKARNRAKKRIEKGE